jgi:hypothetical protein
MGFKVGDEYRTNELSLTPGGSEVKSITSTDNQLIENGDDFGFSGSAF